MTNLIHVYLHIMFTEKIQIIGVIFYVGNINLREEMRGSVEQGGLCDSDCDLDISRKLLLVLDNNLCRQGLIEINHAPTVLHTSLELPSCGTDMTGVLGDHTFIIIYTTNSKYRAFIKCLSSAH